MFTTRTLLEGKWAMLVLLALGVAGVLIWCWWAAGISFALLAFTISFFRDPERVVPADPKLIVAPADGKIVEIKPVNETTMVAIFLSVFDVHVQRSPIAGEIKSVRFTPGRFFDARNPKAVELNENRVVEIESADGFRVTVKQIAGLIARRIVGWSDTGARLAKGERFGMIRFGSRVELYLPAGAEIVAKVGDYAKGGETIIARRPSP